MRVTHVVPAIALSGVPKFAADLAVAQAKAGYTVQVMSLVQGSQQRRIESLALRDQLASADVPLIELGAKDLRAGLPLLAFRFARHFWRRDGHILHAHDHSSEFLSAMIGRLRPVVRARTIHNRPPPVDKFYARFIERAPTRELVVAVSNDIQAEHRAFRNALNAPPPLLEKVIVNGVTPAPKIHAPRDLQSIRSEGLRLGFFGRAVPQKGLDTLADAIRMLDDIPLHVDIFSDAEPTNPWVRDLAARPDRVRLSPLVADARSRMADYDAVVMPSRFEGLPLVALEAFAAGTPVVATNASGLREALPDNWPLMCRPDDPKSLAAIIRDVHQGHWDPKHLSEDVKAHAATFTIESCAKDYEQAYVELLQVTMR